MARSLLVYASLHQVCGQTSGNVVAELLFRDKYCLQSHRKSRTSMYSKWGEMMAMRLAESVTELMQSVSQHRQRSEKCPAFDLEVLGLIKKLNCFMLPVASEPGGTRKRNDHLTGLSKILCLLFEGKVEERHGRS